MPQPTTLDAYAVSHLFEMWGGTGNGSWSNTKLPDNTSYFPDPAIETQARNNLMEEVNGIVTDGRGVRNGAGVVSYAAYPYINIAKYTTRIAVVPANTPYVPVFYSSSINSTGGDGGGSREFATWAQAPRAMAQHGIPIPDGMTATENPNGTPDTDGTLAIWQPDWTWPGRPADTRYWGRYYELFGAISPEQNARWGREARWTCKQAGRVVGVLNDKRARPIDRTSGADVLDTSNPLFVAPTPQPPLAGQETKTYPGWGREGLATQNTATASASAVPQIVNQMITMRDLTRTNPTTGARGYIDHTIGYMMYPAPTAWKTVPHFVWPAMRYDGASRYFMPHGTRWRLPADWVVDPAKDWRVKMIETALRDYGMVFTETTGTLGVSFRAEAGSGPQWEFGTGGINSANQFMKVLFGGCGNSLRMLAVGSDANFNPTDGPVVVDPNPTPGDTTPPTISTVSPAANATNVALDVKPSVTFNEAVQAVTTGTFSLSRAGQAVPAGVSGAGASWTLSPSQPLIGGTVYTVTITGGASGVKDLAGNALATTSTRTFTTATPPPPPVDPVPTVGRPIRGKWRRV